MKFHVRQLPLILAVVFAINTLSLFSPKFSPESEDAKWHTLREYGPIRVIVNVDSHEFMVLARNPELILTPEHKLRQNRPGYIFLGAAFSFALRPLKVISPVGPEFFGFLLLIAIVVSLSVLLIFQIMDGASIHT